MFSSSSRNQLEKEETLLPESALSAIFQGFKDFVLVLWNAVMAESIRIRSQNYRYARALFEMSGGIVFVTVRASNF